MQMTKRSFFIGLALAIAFALIGYEANRFVAYLIYAVAISAIGALSLWSGWVPTPEAFLAMRAGGDCHF